MEFPRFEEHLKTAASARSPGDAFQDFAHEVLLEDYPDLHPFPSGGKDGGIDLVESRDGRRTVVECKYVGADGLQPARQRWLEVAGHLGEHLSDAGGPTRGQSQYAPWYRADRPISEYVFCVSSVLGNLGQTDQLRQEIAEFFSGLAASRAHLSHLSGLSVTVLDWNDLKTRLSKRPHLLFRWFKLTRHYGLGTLDEVPDYRTFRSYLFSDRLPYYSRRRHLDVTPAPEGASVLDEEGLLRLVDGGHLTGLILTGGGGVGKTRLTLEIGWLAQAEGWVVLRVLRRLERGAIDHLAESVTPETKVLLLIDYVETQRDFAELVEVLNDRNDALRLRLRYVANCRASYYSTIATTERHTEVNILPAAGDSSLVGWFESYQHQTVRHILEHSGIEVTERHLKVCRDLPVFAVFMAYLRATGRDIDLESLLEEEDFSRWLVKRLQLSFGDANVSTTLAQLVALFPLPAHTVHHPDLKEHRVFLDRLATDRWIEKLQASELLEADTWVMAHDVLADQILLSYLRSIPHTKENFIHDLFFLSRRLGCLRSVLLTLQRLIEKTELNTLNWPKILGKEVDKEVVQESIKARLIADGTSPLARHIHSALLQAGKGELILEFEEALMVEHSAPAQVPEEQMLEFELARLSEDRVAKNAIHSYYAWLNAGRETEQVREFVVTWLSEFKADTEASYIYTSWLDAGGDRELVRDSISTWLIEHRDTLNASFVYNSWLDAGGGAELVRDSIVYWLTEHGTTEAAAFVYRAWLDAGGDTGMIRDSLRRWLVEHGADLPALFVYRAWLDAGGSTEIVQEAILAWLAAYATEADAQFVYKAWLDAGGSLEMIRESLVAWLEKHGGGKESDFVYKAWLERGGSFTAVSSQAIQWLSRNWDKEEAGFIAKFLANQVDIPVETVKDILNWCRLFPTNEDAIWRLTRLRRHLLREAVAEEVCAASEAVLILTLSTASAMPPILREQITTLLSFIINAPGLREGHLRPRVDELLLRWLRYPSSYGDFPRPHSYIQRRSYVQRVADLIDAGALSVTEDREALKRFMRWVEHWDAEEKPILRPLIVDLERRHPAPGVWDIVKFG